MKSLRWIVLVLLCLAATAGLGLFKYGQIREAIAFGESFPETVEAVEPFTVREDRFRPSMTVTADVLAVRTVDVRSELEGRIETVGFTSGGRVEAGQLLIGLDVSEERAALEAAEAEARIARLALERVERLVPTGAATAAELDAAEARHAAAVAARDRLAAVIDKRRLRAPFSGRAGLHTYEVGGFLDAGAIVTRLVAVDEGLWLDFFLPQDHAGLALGTRVDWRTGEVRGTAEIVARDASVQEASRNVRFRARTGAGDALVPGMVVRAEVPIGRERTVALVPSAAVRRDTFGAGVFVLEPAEEGAGAPERAVRRSVVPGAERDGMTIILDGLRAGERVAATGAFKLRDGVLVGASTRQAPDDSETGS